MGKTISVLAAFLLIVGIAFVIYRNSSKQVVSTSVPVPTQAEPSVTPLPTSAFSDLTHNWTNFNSSALNISFKYPPGYVVEEKNDPAYGSSVTIKTPKTHMVLNHRKKIAGYGGDFEITFSDILINNKPVILFDKPLRRETWHYPKAISYFTTIETPDNFQWNFGANYSFTKVTPEKDFYYYDLILSTLVLN